MSVFIEKQSELINIDEALIRVITEQKDKEYWSYKGRSIRENTHVYYQYPAMMVPYLQRDLIQMIINLQPGIKYVLDPFVGSGTTMTESMFHGLNFVGQDINPLSILLCKAKMGPFQPIALITKAQEINKRAESDLSEEITADFLGLTKWFRSDVAIELSKLQRAITEEKYLWARRFFWISLCEVIRLSSNSRTSTYKLHIRPKEEIEKRNISPINLFKNIVNRNISELNKQKNALDKLKILKKGYYQGNIEIYLQDSSQRIILPKRGEFFDLVVTSPPYGDNKTTVPYGQNSFLQLQWIDFKDVDYQMDSQWLRTTLEIDSRSLGGRIRGLKECLCNLEKISPSLSNTIKRLEEEKSDRMLRVLAFFNDLNKCIYQISKVLKQNAYLIWTIGNRRVGGIEIPTDLILIELMHHQGMRFVTGVSRDILSKRMANRNNIASTMRKERILIFRKI